jgi:hypothetical protein
VLLGGDGDDVLNGAGDDASDDKSGGNGKDQLYGQAGNDELRGANGKDLLDGGDGDDTCIDARTGNDKGNGNNTFVNCESDGSAPTGTGLDADAIEAATVPDPLEGGDTASRLGLIGSEQPTDGGTEPTTAPSPQPIPEPTTTPTPTAAPTATPTVTTTGDIGVDDQRAATATPSTSPLPSSQP